MAKVQEIHITARLLQPASNKQGFKLPENASLLEVLQVGAQVCGAMLLPNADSPLDRLHNLGKHDEPGPAITDLETALGEYLKRKDTTQDFGIELVLAFRVNTRWAIAPEASLSPRQILGLVGLDTAEYSLYREHSADLLPIDTPITIERGMAFEAQRDGKYGECGREN